MEPKRRIKDTSVYTKKEAARVLMIDPRTLGGLVARGTVEAITDRYKKVKFNKDYIDALVAKMKGDDNNE